MLSMDLVSNPVMSTRYHSCQEQHYQALTTPTVASPVSNHVRLGRCGRRHHFKEMDQDDRLVD